MSLTSNVIVRQVYARIGAFQGTASEIATDYTNDAALSSANTESFPLQSMYDMLTGVENEIATAIAMNANNVLRTDIGDIITVASGALVPDISDGGFPVIGEWGQVRDAGTGIPLTPGMHEDEIIALSNGPTGLFKTTYHSYAVRFPRIYATVSPIEIDCCVWDYTTRAAAIAANEALLFQQCQDAYFYGLMSNLKNEDPLYSELSNQYMPLYQEWLKAQQPETDLVGVAAS